MRRPSSTEYKNGSSTPPLGPSSAASSGSSSSFSSWRGLSGATSHSSTPGATPQPGMNDTAMFFQHLGDDFKRPAWFMDLFAHRRLPTEKTPKNGYSPVLETRCALNQSGSKFIVLGLDYERELAPFASIENPQGRGVLLTMQELKELLHEPWCEMVREHMDTPSYRVRTTYTDRHEMRCTMTDGYPAVQISPLGGEHTSGFVILGRASWEGLIHLRSFVLGLAKALDKESMDAEKTVKAMVDEQSWVSVAVFRADTLHDIKFALDAMYHDQLTSEGFHFNAHRLRMEMVYRYPDLTASMVLQGMRKKNMA